MNAFYTAPYNNKFVHRVHKLGQWRGPWVTTLWDTRPAHTLTIIIIILFTCCTLSSVCALTGHLITQFLTLGL